MDEVACTGCQLCEVACTVAVPDQFNADLVARRAAYIPFPQAVPKKAVIERAGTSPCSFACPAGIQAHGYVSLIRSGEYEKAFQLVLETTPLVGTLGRACYAPCEVACTRGDLEGTLPIRRLKRFVDPTGTRPPRRARHRGRAAQRQAGRHRRLRPAGLTAAWQLARQATASASSRRRPSPVASCAWPSRPTACRRGSSRATSRTCARHRRGDRHRQPRPDLDALEAEGYDAILLATGTPRSTRLDVPGEDRPGVIGGVEFLRAVKLGEPIDLTDKRVVVVGGGNVAMDAARTARRLGARSVTVAYRRGRDEMPAHDAEVEDAEREGVAFSLRSRPLEVLGDERGEVSGLRCTRMRLGEPDASGRRRPEPVAGSEFAWTARSSSWRSAWPPTRARSRQLATKGNGTLVADRTRSRRACRTIFAAGDVVTGPTDITRAVGEGRRAAHMIDRWLTGGRMNGFDDRCRSSTRQQVLARQKAYTLRPPAADAPRWRRADRTSTSSSRR